MSEITFGEGAYRRTAGGLPELRLVNMFVESIPVAGGGVVLLSRPGLLASASRGAGPVRGIFWRDGLFGDAVFCVSGNQLYRGATLLGTIDGTGPVSFASSDTELLVTAGASVWSYNGTNLQAVVFPDGANVAAVAYLGGLFVYIRAGSQKWYWSAVNDGRTIDPLSFASAESAPDGLLGVLAIGDELWLLGSATIEPWALDAADADIPFTRIDQRLFRKGVLATGCAVDLDNAMFWISDSGIVFRAADAPLRVSDHGIEERLSKSSAVSAFGFVLEGHTFFCVRCDEGTFAYDAATEQWCEFASFGRPNFCGQVAVTNGRDVLFGDDANGTLWAFGPSYTDAGGQLERLFTAAFRVTGGVAQVLRLNVDVNVGRAELLEGPGSDPQIEMRYSRDGGITYGDWEAVSMGAVGHYRTRPEWRALGTFDAPGGMMEFRVTDPTGLRLSGVFVNENGGGRSR